MKSDLDLAVASLGIGSRICGQPRIRQACRGQVRHSCRRRQIRRCCWGSLALVRSSSSQPSRPGLACGCSGWASALGRSFLWRRGYAHRPVHC